MRARLKTLWNRLMGLRKRAGTEGRLNLGLTVCDGEVSHRRFVIAQRRRTEHIAVLGKTGTGKSSLLRSLCS
jgi:ABC-type transport system involved in cytochrome bd biosynthesis fused ATPase/permease subunit